MTKKLAAFDRLLLFILGIVLIAAGAWPILVHYRVRPAQIAALWIDRDVWASLPSQPWWPFALAGTAAVLLVFGLWLILANLATRKIIEVPSAASSKQGEVKIHLANATHAMAKHLEQQEGINSAHRALAFDRGIPQLTLTINAEPHTPWAQVAQLAAQAEQDFRQAFPDSDVRTVYKLYYDRISG